MSKNKSTGHYISMRERKGERQRDRERDRDRQTEIDRQTNRKTENSKTLFYKDCSLGSILAEQLMSKNKSTGHYISMRERKGERQRQRDRERQRETDRQTNRKTENSKTLFYNPTVV